MIVQMSLAVKPSSSFSPPMYAATCSRGAKMTGQKQVQMCEHNSTNDIGMFICVRDFQICRAFLSSLLGSLLQRGMLLPFPPSLAGTSQSFWAIFVQYKLAIFRKRQRRSHT